MIWPKVSIVVTAYLKESQRYLDACVESIRRIDYPPELIDVVIVTPTWYMPEYEGYRTIHPQYGSYHNPTAVNFGVENSDQTSKHILLINDDVILTRNCLKSMVMVAQDNNVIVAATSPCDNQYKYVLNFGFQTRGAYREITKRFHRYEEFEHDLPEAMAANSLYQPALIFTDQLCLYANLIPRSLWRDVGGFDERFKTGFDDTDYCMRAKQKGATLVIALNALIWHFGGASADTTMGDLKSDLRAENERIFKEKWGML